MSPGPDDLDWLADVVEPLTICAVCGHLREVGKFQGRVTNHRVTCPYYEGLPEWPTDGTQA